MVRSIKESLEIIDAWTNHYWADYLLRVPEVPDSSKEPVNFDRYMHECVIPKMNAGLTYQTIEEKLTRLPFNVPREVMELYHWHDGGDPPSIPLLGNSGMPRWFPPLDRAISTALHYCHNVAPGENVFFLFGMNDDTQYWTVGSQEQMNTGPIYSGDCISDMASGLCFKSLADFFDKILSEVPAERSQWKKY